MYRPRIYVHAPYKPEPDRAVIKDAVLQQIGRLGFDPQEFAVSGIPSGDAWTFDRAIDVMRQCDGALILALMRWTDSDGVNAVPIPSEYSHFEGALALACNLPTMVIAEERMPSRGILSQAGGSFVVRLPAHDPGGWLAAGQLLRQPPFRTWVTRVRARNDVFFGYCSKASQLARNLKTYLTQERGLRVLDWATDFRPGRTIMEEVARAAASSRCGLFLFTADDPIEGAPSRTAIPRDNVLLEAGYFMSAHSARRVVVLREGGTRMPADLGGMIYLTIDDREDWRAAAEAVADALQRQIFDEVAG